jgi:hypothetical protein
MNKGPPVMQAGRKIYRRLSLTAIYTPFSQKSLIAFAYRANWTLSLQNDHNITINATIQLQLTDWRWPYGNGIRSWRRRSRAIFAASIPALCTLSLA